MRLLKKLQILLQFNGNPVSLIHRHFALSVNKAPKRHRVLVSSSTNIYENLALEDWLYETSDLDSESILLLWHNTPCVVFGRHQNPWVECNVPFCEKNDVHLVRRKSGGGTVYHDEGNVNCSFLMHESRYNRRQNLQLVVDAMRSRWDVPLSINKRDDIVFLDKYKISGTASKIGKKRTYHHLTLLFNVDKDRLNSILYTNLEGVKSKATPSTRMMVTNLADHVPNIDFNSLVHVISEQFAQQCKTAVVEHVDPMNKSSFPGVDKHLAELTSWDWIFGKTPPFSIQRSFPGKYMNIDNILEVDVGVTKGCIHDLKLNLLESVGIDKEAYLALRIALEETKLDASEVSRQLSQVKLDWIGKRIYNVETHAFLDWTLMCIMETLNVFQPRKMTGENYGNTPERVYR